jgi:hypothetical protein
MAMCSGSRTIDGRPQRSARCLERAPVRRVFERLVVFRQRLLRAPLLHQHITPCLQRVREARAFFVREGQLFGCAGEISPHKQRLAPLQIG